MSDDVTARLPHQFWDRSMRLLLERPKHLRAVLRLCEPELADRLNFDRIKHIKRSFVSPDYQGFEADVVVRLGYRGESAERDVIVYVLLEHQSKVDWRIPRRLLSYMLRIWETQERESNDASARLAPVIPVVFYTGPHPWTASREFRELIAGPPELLKYAPQFDILYLGLPEVSPAVLEAVGPFGWVLRVLQGIGLEPQRFTPLLQRAVDAIRPLFGDEWRELAEFLARLVTHSRPMAEHASLERTVLKAAPSQEQKRELTKIMKTWADHVMEQGVEQGRERAARRILLSQGTHRFGAPTQAQRTLIEATHDPEQLETLCEAIFKASSWDDLLSQAGGA